ncbi:MAG: RNA polymerase sigma factor [bacterium]|nr:RNA polymerase sigma factor [bacterium]
MNTMHSTDSEKYSDQELVSQSVQNNERFKYIIEKYEQPLLRYIRRLTNVTNEDAEDILQETFIKAYQNLNSYNPKMPFSSWIYRIAHNQVISDFRSRKARPHGNSVVISDEQYDSMFQDDTDIEQDIDKAILREHMQTALQKLDAKYRDVLVLKYLEEKSYKEISDILRKPEGTIATLINRAKKKLKKVINQQ